MFANVRNLPTSRRHASSAERPEPDRSLMQPLTIPWLVGTLVVTGGYATVRYNVFGNVAWEQWPLYIVNKALALSGLIFLAFSYLVGKIRFLRVADRAKAVVLAKFFGLGGFSLCAMHAGISLSLAGPVYYPKLYADLRMNLTGELCLLAGIISVWCFVHPVVMTIPHMNEDIGVKRWSRGQRMGYLGLAAAAVHTGVMGFAGWLTPAKWPGHLPPISLIGFIAALIPLGHKLAKEVSNG
jgi:DMSO/TMAO reductase YedYZ heme-binding membrane subunit